MPKTKTQPKPPPSRYMPFRVLAGGQLLHQVLKEVPLDAFGFGPRPTLYHYALQPGSPFDVRQLPTCPLSGRDIFQMKKTEAGFVDQDALREIHVVAIQEALDSGYPLLSSPSTRTDNDR